MVGSYYNLFYFVVRSGLGLSQSEQQLDDAFSDEEGSGYFESPTRNSYRPVFSSECLGSLDVWSLRFTTSNTCSVPIQVTAAQVETYRTKTFAGDSPSVPDPQDSSRSVSPGANNNTWNSPTHNVRVADPARALHGHPSGKLYDCSCIFISFFYLQNLC